jgi:hypothetical protein
VDPSAFGIQGPGNKLATLHTKVAMDLHERLGTALTSAV